MGMRTVRLKFAAPVHFGRGRLEDGACTCDAGTLFSAMFIEATKMDGEGSFLAAARSGELSISNAFPYIGDVLYLPKPRAVRREGDGEAGSRDSRAKKASKKLAYIPAASYRDFLLGSFDAVGELKKFSEGLGSANIVTKVNLMREHKDDADPYHVGSFSYARHSGIYFIVDGTYDLRPILDSLCYSGIGGERSSGYGRFEYSMTDEDPVREASLKEQGATNILLSTAAPRSEELSDALLEGAQYRVVRCGGFVQSSTHHSSPQKKRDLYLFAAGSMFAKRFAGDVFDVNETPNTHPVYRYARAMWMGV